MPLNEISAWLGIATSILTLFGVVVTGIVMVTQIRTITDQLVKDVAGMEAEVKDLRKDFQLRNEMAVRVETTVQSLKESLEEHAQHDSERFGQTNLAVDQLSTRLQTTVSGIEAQMAAQSRAIEHLTAAVEARNLK